MMKMTYSFRRRLRRIVPDSTRALLAGLFIAGIFYLLFDILGGGGWANPNVIIALIIECALLYLSIFKQPPTKTELVVLSLIALVYLLTSWFMSVYVPFHHTVIMATAGLLIYGAVLAEPKYPLTKRAIGTGILVGVIMTFLGIWLALKLGVVFLVGAEMLGAILLSIGGRYTPQENTIVVAIANSSAMVSIGVLITFPAIAIFDPGNPLFNITHVDYNSTITLSFIVLVTGLSAIFGIILLAPFRDRFKDEPWPQVQPQAYTINSIGGDAEAKKTVGIGITTSAAWVGTVKATQSITGADLSAFPHALGDVIPAASAVPGWIGISNSPMMAGIGFFVGWKRTIIIGIGSLASFLIWLLLEGANPSIMYEEHIKRAEIIYIALGVFVTVIAGDFLGGRKKKCDEEIPSKDFEEKAVPAAEKSDKELIAETPPKSDSLPRIKRVKEELLSIEMFKEEVREIVADPRAYLKSRKGQLPPWIAFVSLGLFIVVGIIVFWIIEPFPGIQIHWLLFLIGTPIALISVYFTARAICETGMLAGYITDIVAIPAILLFKVSFAVITTFISMLGALQDAAIALLVHLKLGELTKVRGRDILKAVFIGAMLGTTIGSFITFTLFDTYNGFGGTDLPSPAAQLFGFLVVSLQGIGNFQLPGMNQFENVHPVLVFAYLISFAIGGFLVGRELNRRGLSPMSLVVGVLIPPATAVAILIGGYINYLVKKKQIPQEPISKADPIQQQIELQDANYNRISRILSGIVAGEAVVTVVWVLGTAITTILSTL
ncbi:MAG: OPT/YSL family transporter [Candidatus Thorarchaeota archaeon]|nr:OPT/YSL family transporter [Candidatus Thorarchaeota archaeon]